MDDNWLILLATVLTGLGATAAAIVAAYALRAQQRGQQRQHDVDNLRWIIEQWRALRLPRQRAAKGLLFDQPDREALRDVLNFWELCGYLVRQGFLTEKAFDMIGAHWVLGWWCAAQKEVGAARLRYADPELFVEFEGLKNRLQLEVVELDAESVQSFLRTEALSDEPEAATRSASRRRKSG